MTREQATQLVGADTGAERYLARLRAALADLPADEVAEIIEDARAHLGELGAELGAGGGTGSPAAPAGPAGSGGPAGPDTGPSEAAFVDRLGAPEAYAADLRAAAGYPPAPPAEQAPRPVRGALAVGLLAVATVVLGLAALASTSFVLVTLPLWAGAAVVGLLLVSGRGPRVPDVAGLAPVRAVRDALPGGRVVGYVASLQPAWWLLRALVAGLVLGAVAGHVLPIAPDGPTWTAALVVGLVGVPVSVWLGHWCRRDRRWLWVVVPLNALALALLVSTVSGEVQRRAAVEAAPTYPPGLSQDGTPVADVRPFDATGAPLTGVYLFDQDGRPLTTQPTCTDDRSTPTVPVPFPHGTATYDDATGRCAPVPPAPLVVTVPRPATTPTPAPTTRPGG